jgi:hypothetical protein
VVETPGASRTVETVNGKRMMNNTTPIENVKAKPLAKQNNEQDNYQNKAQTSARIVSPASAIWPRWQGGDQEQNQNYQQYETHNFLI